MQWRLALKTRVHSYVQLLSNNEVKVLLKLQWLLVYQICCIHKLLPHIFLCTLSGWNRMGWGGGRGGATGKQETEGQPRTGHHQPCYTRVRAGSPGVRRSNVKCMYCNKHAKLTFLLCFFARCLCYNFFHVKFKYN